MNEAYKLLLPLYERGRTAKLRDAHSKLATTWATWRTCPRPASASWARYRVGFFGAHFGDLNGREFIYKEPRVTPLPVISLRLQEFYGRQLGEGRLVLLQDSGDVDVSKLDSDKAYIQARCGTRMEGGGAGG